MRYIVSLIITLVFAACSSGLKLVDKTTANGERIIVNEGNFSGIDYIYVEKRVRRKVKYKLFYDCECGVNIVALGKDFVSENNQTTAWTAVTDTSFGKMRFFGEEILESRMLKPISFMSITKEETDALTEGIKKADKDCCKNEKKPIEKIIGYVRVL